MTEKQFHLSPSPSLISSSAQHSIAKKTESYGRNLFLYLFFLEKNTTKYISLNISVYCVH